MPWVYNDDSDYGSFLLFIEFVYRCCSSLPYMQYYDLLLLYLPQKWSITHDAYMYSIFKAYFACSASMYVVSDYGVIGSVWLVSLHFVHWLLLIRYQFKLKWALWFSPYLRVKLFSWMWSWGHCSSYRHKMMLLW